jgi:hypothetical protein
MLDVGFLTRFQEHMDSILVCKNDATKTQTLVDTEKSDPERAVLFSRTGTFTEVKREQVDTDPQARSFHAIPRL